jgi:hypothetical protein
VGKEICALSSALQLQFQRLLQDYRVADAGDDLVGKERVAEGVEGDLSHQFE